MAQPHGGVPSRSTPSCMVSLTRVKTAWPGDDIQSRMPIGPASVGEKGVRGRNGEAKHGGWTCSSSQTCNCGTRWAPPSRIILLPSCFPLNFGRQGGIHLGCRFDGNGSTSGRGGCTKLPPVDFGESRSTLTRSSLIGLVSSYESCLFACAKPRGCFH